MIGSDAGDIISGGADHDYLDGAGGADNIRGGEGDDHIVGGAGPWNLLHGEAGNDVIIGGDGDDTISGGMGYDVLTGGAGGDNFVFRSELVQSPWGSVLVSNSWLDTITDFDSSSDAITGALRGGSYAEFATSQDDVLWARDEANDRYADSGVGQAFAYNEAADRGFLFWDTDADGRFDSTVILEGCGRAEDFSAWHLV